MYVGKNDKLCFYIIISTITATTILLSVYIYHNSSSHIDMLFYNFQLEQLIFTQTGPYLRSSTPKK